MPTAQQRDKARQSTGRDELETLALTIEVMVLYLKEQQGGWTMQPQQQYIFTPNKVKMDYIQKINKQQGGWTMQPQQQ